MTTVTINLDKKSALRAQTILREFPPTTKRALKKAFVKGIGTFRLQAREGVTRVYSISRGEASKSGRVNAAYYDTAATITYAGNKISLHDFNASPRIPVQKALVWGQQIHGGGGNFPNAFVAKMKSGHIGIFERDGDESLPISEIQGVALAQMVGRSNIEEEAETAAREAAKEALDAAISEVINNY